MTIYEIGVEFPDVFVVLEVDEALKEAEEVFSIDGACFGVDINDGIDLLEVTVKL